MSSEPGQLFFAEVMGRAGKWSSLHSVDKEAWARRENHLFARLQSARAPQGSIKDIIAAVAKEFTLSTSDLCARKRWQPLATARQLAIYLCYLKGYGDTKTSQDFGLSRTTFHYSTRTIRDRLTVEPELRQRFQRLAETLSINPGDSGVNKP